MKHAKNIIWPMAFSVNFLKMVGFLIPENCSKYEKMALHLYGFLWFAYTNGIYIINQVGDLFQIWGNLPLMVNTSFLLFTNLNYGMKIINVMMRKEAVQAMIDDGEIELATEQRTKGIRIIKRCNRETTWHLYSLYFFCGLTVLCLAVGAEKGSLLVRAWYPFDTSKSPIYEIAYFHQITGLSFNAAIHICLDTLVTTSIAKCCCRLKLLKLSLMNLCSDDENTNRLHFQDDYVMPRLKDCIRKHQAVLKILNEIQRCFSEPVLAQFAVSSLIICVTTHQLVLDFKDAQINMVRIIAMSAYLLCMLLQVFSYCYQGNQILNESTEISSAAYSCPWYLLSLRVRRSLLVVMARSARETRLTAAGITTLSFDTFTSIVKASYTFFTVLQCVEDRQK